MASQFDISSFSLPTTSSAAGGNNSSSVSKSDNIQNVQIIKKLTIEDIKAKYNLSDTQIAELQTKYPTLLAMSEEDITKSINIYLSFQTNSIPDNSKLQSDENTESTTIKGINYNFKDFNSKDAKEKGKLLLDAYAQNLNSAKWDSYSEEVKQQKRIEAANLFIKQFSSDENIDYEKIVQAIKKDPDAFEFSNEQIDQMKRAMLDIQVANANNKRIDEYLNQDPSIIRAQQYEFMEHLHNTDIEAFKSLSIHSIVFYNKESVAISAARKFFDNQSLSSTQISDEITKYNKEHKDEPISRASLSYDYLKNKPLETEYEEKLYAILDSQNTETHGQLGYKPDSNPANTQLLIMRNSETYKTAKNKYKEQGKTDAEAEQLAYDEYLITEFSSNNDFMKVLHKMQSGLDDIEQNKLLKRLADLGLLKKYEKNVVNDDQAMWAGAYKYVDGKAFNNINGSEKQYFWSSTAANSATMDGDYDRVNDINRNNITDRVAQRKIAPNSPNPAMFVAKVEFDHINNRDLYSEEILENILKTGGTGLYEIATNSQIEKIIEGNGEIASSSPRLAKSYAGSGATYKGKHQVMLANKAMDISYGFDDETAKDIQKILVDDICKYEVQNQAEAHNIVSSSKYSEVQEYAASNIHKLDESVQGEAIRITYETGNEKAISACESQLNQCSGVNPSESTYENYTKNQSIQETISNLDMSKQEDVQKLLDLVDNNSVDISAYLASCSQKDKQAFVEKYCNVANESKLLAFIRQNPSLRGLVLKYAKGLNKEDVFKAVYKGNAGEISKLIKELGLNPIKLANSYKEIAPDIAITTSNSELARNILTNPAQWGYNLGNSATQKLQQIASKANYPDPNENLTKLEPYKA